MVQEISNTYQILGKIGAGNSGEIYKAYHKKLGKYVVLKKIRTEIKDIVNKRAEVDVLKNLRHSCLPQVLDFLEIEGDVYTVMDFIPGNSFKQYLDAGREFPETSVIIWAKQICATLCYLHGQDPPIIHSDLKPGNVMLMPDGNICLIDFNISASLNGDYAWVTGYTNGYASPEQIEALAYNQNELNPALWKKVDERADIYSLGATIYHILCGEKPQTDADGYVEDIRNKNSKINEVFAAVIMKCLEPDPEKRYQSARELLTDLQNMPEKSRKYKALLVRQKIIYAAVVISTFLFLGIALAGYFRVDEDRKKEYDILVRQVERCMEEADYESLDIFYQKAIDLFPDKIEAYYQKALSLSRQGLYGQCIQFINSEILENHAITKDALNNVYYLLGNAHENMQDYESAERYYYEALKMNPDNSDYYRDYAIALAYNGKVGEAEQVLNEAKEKGLASVEVRYVEGEIAYSLDDFSKAKEIFMDCIEQSTDSYIQTRAYLMAAKCIDGQGRGTDGNLEKAELLEKARSQLPRENNIGILEMLAQTYGNLGQALQDTEYYRKALDVFEQIEEQGMASYDTSYNLSVLYQNIQDYTMASETLNNMLQTYNENYKTYKGLAFLEVAIQNDYSNDLKNYKKFDEYYHQAENLYQEQEANNANDMEMDRLRELHDQALENGWVAE